MRPRRPAPEDFLPLTPAIAHILLAVADEDRHGYAIMQEVERMTDGGVRMGPGTLYGTIKRMLAAGLLKETASRAEPEASEAERAAKGERSGASQVVCRGPRRSKDDERRRYYRATALGREVLEAETARMSALVSAARAKRVRAR